MSEDNHSVDSSPGNSGERTEGSVHDWIERAKRAHDLVEQVDLGKVSSHDAGELDKLDKVTSALESLSKGEDVDYVPGVDMEEVADLDPEQIRRSSLMETLETAGYGDRLGRIFMSGTEDALRPLDLVPHQQGLPDYDLCLAPEFAPAESALGIFVSSRGVFVAVVPEPVSKHRWRIVRSRPYDDEDEMLATIGRFMTKSAE